MRVKSCKGASFAASVASFVEEAFIRRELSDNFCYYNKNYDNISGAAGWAITTLQVTNKPSSNHGNITGYGRSTLRIRENTFMNLNSLKMQKLMMICGMLPR